MKRWLMGSTTLAWAIGVMLYANKYIVTRVSLPNAVGYERAWDWQLFFFSLTRLPLLVAMLILVLWLEWKWIRS